MTLLKEDTNRQKIKHYFRSIILFNANLKILAKMLAKVLAFVIHKLVDTMSESAPCQAGVSIATSI